MKFFNGGGTESIKMQLEDKYQRKIHRKKIRITSLQ